MSTKYGQSLAHDGEIVTVAGFPTADEALWVAARLIHLPVGKLRRVLNDDQRRRVVSVATKKLFGRKT